MDAKQHVLGDLPPGEYLGDPGKDSICAACYSCSWLLLPFSVEGLGSPYERQHVSDAYDGKCCISSLLKTCSFIGV